MNSSYITIKLQYAAECHLILSLSRSKILNIIINLNVLLSVQVEVKMIKFQYLSENVYNVIRPVNFNSDINTNLTL